MTKRVSKLQNISKMHTIQQWKEVTATCKNMDGSYKHNVEAKKGDIKKCLLL